MKMSMNNDKLAKQQIEYAEGFYEIMPLGPVSRARATVFVEPLLNGRDFHIEGKDGKYYVTNRKNFEWMMPNWTIRGFKREGSDNLGKAAVASDVREILKVAKSLL